jgi:hypothetical protein
MLFRTISLLTFSTVAVAMHSPFALAQENVISTTVCDVARDPASFDNKFVRIRATLAGNFEISSIREPDSKDCKSLWFTYPGSGPAAYVSLSTGGPTQPRPAVHLNNDRQFHQFQKYVDAKMYPKHQDSICMDCNRYEVTAVMVGLVEFAGSGLGFGHMNAFPAQFVLQSIEQSSVKDLSTNYDAGDFAPKPTRFPTGYLTGTLIGPDGRPVPDAELNIYSANDPPKHIEEDSATTDAKGRFKFAVPPGDYVIGFNTFWVPSPKAPFAPTYYPSKQQRSLAKVVSVSDKQHVRNLALKLPRPLTARRFPVKILSPDGKPVGDANVWLSQVSDPTSVVGMSVSHTAADGTFDLIGFEGIDYILHADKYAGLARVSCAPNALIRAVEPIPARIQLSLTITDFNICKNIDFEVPSGVVPRP